jgi:hypothetical protein
MLIVVAPLVYHDGLPVSDEFRNLVTVAGTTLAKCYKTFYGCNLQVFVKS